MFVQALSTVVGSGHCGWEQASEAEAEMGVCVQDRDLSQWPVGGQRGSQISQWMVQVEHRMAPVQQEGWPLGTRVRSLWEESCGILHGEGG